MYTSIWCLLGELKCSHASTLSLPEDAPVGRWRKELPYQEERRPSCLLLHWRRYGCRKLAKKGRFGAKTCIYSCHAISKAQQSSQHISGIAGYLVLQIKEEQGQVLKIPIVKWLHRLSPKTFTISSSIISSPTLSSPKDAQTCRQLERPQNTCGGNYW